MEKSLKGLFKTITVTDTSIILLKNSGKRLFEFPLSEVTNFIFEKGTTWKFGFLTVCLLNGSGYNVNRNTAASDKNTITFNSQNNDSFDLLYSELRGMVQLKSLEDLKPEPVNSPELKPTVSAPVKNSPAASKFCSNCGAKLTGGKFCSECGAPIPANASSGESELPTPVSPPRADDKKSFWQQAVEQGNEINRQKAAAKAAQPKPQSKKERIKENKANGVACCPKCGSTSLSANKKGFGIGKAIVGAGVTSLIPGAGIIGAVAGNAGAKKVIVTCLNCGHQWKA